MASPAYAQTRAEYDAQILEAQNKVQVAKDALAAAQKAYDDAVAHGVELSNAIEQAQANLQNAQQAYNESLILDPSWVRPTKEIQVSEEIPYTVQIPHVETVRQVTLIPRTSTTVVPAGLTAKSYNMQGYNNAPPLPGENRLVSTQTVNNISFDWGGGQILNSGLYEDVIVKFTGNIYIPYAGTYGFYAPGDDGVQVIIDGNRIINDWYDKGGGGSQTTLYLSEGSHTITLWFYENGGGANVWLYWAKPGYGWEIVPSSAFGEQTITETVYDEVVTYTEVTTYTEEIRYNTVWHTETVPDETAIQPQIQDSSLLPAIVTAQSQYDTAIANKTQNDSIIEVASTDVINKQQELNVAEQELEAIPPFREPTPTPEATTQPTKEPEIPITPEIPKPDTPTPTESNATVVEAEAQLEERATQNDTGVLPYTVADVVTEIQAEQVLETLTDPAVMAEAIGQGLTDTAEFIGQVFTDPGKTLSAVGEAVSKAGLDMSDDQREKAQEVIIPVVIVSQIASVIVGRIK